MTALIQSTHTGKLLTWSRTEENSKDEVDADDLGGEKGMKELQTVALECVTNG